MKAIQMRLNAPCFDDELATAATYVDEDDYAIDYDALEDTEMLSAGRSLRSFDLD